MKYYVARNIETGEFATSWELDVEPLDDGIFFSEEYPTDIPMLTIGEYEIVSLKDGPTEPCSLCREGGDLHVQEYNIILSIIKKPGVINYNYPSPPKTTKYQLLIDNYDPNPVISVPIQACPNCGRSLT